MGMIKAAKYALNGLVRTVIAGPITVLAAVFGKRAHEEQKLLALKQNYPDAKAQEIYDTPGILYQHYINGLCGIDTENLQTSLMEPAVINCIKQDFQATPTMDSIALSGSLGAAFIVGLFFS